MEVNYWHTRGSAGAWYVFGFNRKTGDGSTLGPFRFLLRAKLVAWWYNWGGMLP